MFKHISFIIISLLISLNNLTGQEKLYPSSFPLGDITLLDGPFKHAQDLNVTTLLKYNANRLLAPYLKEAGLTPKGESYLNWIGLDGHIGGHYLSALAISYAATGNLICKQRLDSMITELNNCQATNSSNVNFVGYVGGVPSGKAMWIKVKNGTPTAVTEAWVPWYNIHKTYAGLRDAWLYAGNDTAKAIFLRFCDWGINLCSGLSDAQMETMLNTEHGGMNEIYADAYQMTGLAKYLTMAKRFSHKVILNSMAASIDNLNNLHANTQVPKAVGFQRIAELSSDNTYVKASKFFWQTVTNNRSLASGGNSRKEFFPQANACADYTTDREGPESCNTNNMLKLTEGLFRMKSDAKYADFYERAMFNHILSTQHPDHGGYVYFTSARPRHYRVYSAPNQAMWCCVGTGMENHGKYGEFIYTRKQDSLFLNLFIPSELNWRDKGVRIKQETVFPDEERTKLIINADVPVAFKLEIRHPWWVPAGALKISIGKDTLAITSQPSTYVNIDRIWSTGDTVTIILPMHNTIEQLPNVPKYIAIMHGPILLGAKTGTEDLTGLVADDSRWGHIAGGSLLSLDKAPIMVGDRSTFLSKINPVVGKSLTFTAPGLFVTKADSLMVFEPFFRIHDSRYMMYWMALTAAEYQTVLANIAAEEKAALELDKRTIDEIAPGEQQPEVSHKLQSLNSNTGNYQNEFWRDASSGGFISYSMVTKKETKLSLMVRYWGNEGLSRTFDILIDGVKLVTENIVGKWNKSAFVNVEYAIPDIMVAGKDSIRVRFQPAAGNYAGGLFYLRILRNIPNLAGTITGNASVCKGNSNVLYSVPSISGATSYNWILPVGASGASTTNSIYVNYSDTAISDSIIVRGVNNYTSGPISFKNIAVNEIPATPVIALVNGLLQSSADNGNQWYKDNFSILNETSKTYTPIADGNYFTIVSLNGCSSDTSNLYNFILSKNGTVTEKSQIEIFPNPTSGQITITLNKAFDFDYKVEVIDNKGSKLTEIKNNKIKLITNIDISKYPSGIYSLRISSGDENFLIKVKKN